jgi:hypothetical protein
MPLAFLFLSAKTSALLKLEDNVSECNSFSPMHTSLPKTSACNSLYFLVKFLYDFTQFSQPK